MKLKLLFCLLMTVLVITGSAQAQQPKKIPRIGYVRFIGSTAPLDPNIEAFLRALRDLGYVEGKNILIEYRYVEAKVDRIPNFVTELMQLKVDVFLSGHPVAIRAAKEATKSIPIVIVSLGDPVAEGLIDSLARPGGNITGLSRLTRDLRGKRLELLKEVVPRISRVGVLWDAANAPGQRGLAFKNYETAARDLKIPLQSLEVSGPNPDLEGAFREAVKGRLNALITARTTVLVRYPKRIAELAIKSRLPSMYEGSEFVDHGGLMSYATNDAESFKRAAWYVDKTSRAPSQPTFLSSSRRSLSL
jgi:putative ABC transport system substrate-binding protein